MLTGTSRALLGWETGSGDAQKLRVGTSSIKPRPAKAVMALLSMACRTLQLQSQELGQLPTLSGNTLGFCADGVPPHLCLL